MKFLSLFTKAPQHQRFSYKPRFYDEQKEEMLARENRIRKEIERERGIVSETQGEYRSRIAGSFQAARKRSQPSTNANATMIRLGILLFLSVFIIAFIQWGKPVLYSLFLFLPVYFYLKFKK
ncbi:MAG: hypothetical protein BroJett042_08820 [Bacteroidota bacterium]|nr:MAG: hypothetical protein UZ12_BCD005002621 [Bacteroidetes bacterium OLB12]GIL22369.1 MAG: hypothetical protein BroJett042_08820 [Bacteroidota bacterium]HNR73947.1 hypothetical protein [Cyclobacteriaceae bacterium]